MTALIFDCDGVLIDSEPIAARAMSELLAEHGLQLSPAECLTRFVSMTVEAEAAHILQHFGLDLLDVFHRELTPRTMRMFETDLRPMPGVIEVLQRLTRGDSGNSCGTSFQPLRFASSNLRAVASNSAPQRLALALRIAGLAPFFEPHIYSASLVPRPKPAPDLFLHAARSLGVSPADCLVIEDSPAGVLAARAAGMRIIGFTGGSHATPADVQTLLQAGAATTFAHWNDFFIAASHANK